MDNFIKTSAIVSTVYIELIFKDIHEACRSSEIIGATVLTFFKYGMPRVWYEYDGFCIAFVG